LKGVDHVGITVQPFTHTGLPGRVIFGAGAAERELAGELQRLGAQRVLLIASGSAVTLARELCADIALFGVFSQVRRHVPVETAERACAAAAGADALLCVGGGSAVGTAKAVALELGLPIVAVPTTYAGSEMTPIWGRTSGGRKRTGTDLRVLPRVVVYDPSLVAALPPSIAGPSAMNAIAHGVEAFYADGASPVTALLAEEGIRGLAAGMVATGVDACSRALYGAYLTAAAFGVSGSGVHHKVCHALGGAFDLPHAELHTVMLPHVVALQERTLPVEMQRVAGALGTVSASAGLFALARAVGAPAALRDIGLREDDLGTATALVEPLVGAEHAPGLLAAAYAGSAVGQRMTRDARSADAELDCPRGV
jgi:alcohol dehydrogenase class IV